MCVSVCRLLHYIHPASTCLRSNTTTLNHVFKGFVFLFFSLQLPARHKFMQGGENNNTHESKGLIPSDPQGCNNNQIQFTLRYKLKLIQFHLNHITPVHRNLECNITEQCFSGSRGNRNTTTTTT